MLTEVRPMAIVDDSKLTEEQRMAVRITDRCVAVTAGAGAGKTRVLVNRYIGLLESGECDVENIVAITFTNKAANEMKERIREMVTQAIASGAAKGDRWESVKDRLSAAYIGTIHSFCGRLLRENPVEARVDPRFSVLDEVESKIILGRSARAAVLHVLDSGVAEVESLVSEMGLAKVVSAVMKTYSAIRGTGKSLEDAEKLSWETFRRAASGTVSIVDQLEQELDALLDLERQGRENPATLHPFKEVRPSVMQALATVRRAANGSVPEGISVSVAGDILKDLEALKRSFNSRIRREPYKSIRESVQALAGELSACVWDLVVIPTALRGFFRILREIDERYAREKKLRIALDYEDLQLKARDLLKRHESVLEFYRRKFKHIMIDEFQDTNGLQEEIIRLLCGESLGEGPILFIVGDPKQSIYKFRGAEVSIFNRVKEDISRSGGEGISLARNFRTASPIMDVINAFFERLMQPAQFEGEGLLDRLSPGRASQLIEFERVVYEPIIAERRKEDDPPRVELLVAPRDRSGVREQVAFEADILARRIRQLVEEKAEIVYEEHTEGGRKREVARPVKYGDIAILFAAGTRMKEYERALYEAGVPYYTVSGRGFYETEEVRDVLTLLKCINSEADLISLAGSLRSPFFGVSDETLLKLVMDKGDLAIGLMEFEDVKDLSGDERERLSFAKGVIQEARSLRSRLSAHELIEFLLERTGYEAYVLTRFAGTRALANLRKLVRIAESFFDVPEILTLSDFLEHVDLLKTSGVKEAEAAVEAETGDTVKLMTIHASKGLEFPVVAVADLGTKFNLDLPDVIFDRDLGLGLSMVVEGLGEGKMSSLKYALVSLDRWRAIEERKRQLYVAMTRARDYLILSGAAISPDKQGMADDLTFLKWISEGFGVPTLQHAVAISGSVIQVTSGTGDAKGRVRIIAAGEADTGGQGPLERRRLVDEVVVEMANASPLAAAHRVDLRRVEANLASIKSGLKRYGTHWVSEFLSYQKCPLLYHYQYRQRIPPLKNLGPRSTMFEELDADMLFEAAEEMGIVEPSADAVLDPIRKGDVVHAVCEKLRRPEELDELLNAALRVYGLEGERLQAAKAEVSQCLKNYVESEVFARVSEATNLSEYPFALLIPGGAVVTGVVDRVVIDDKEDAAWVVDFKTNDVTLEYIDDTAEYYALQVRLYAEAVRRARKLKVARASLFFLESNMLYDIDVSDDKLEEALELAGRMCFEMDAYDGLTPKATPGNHCGYCGYRVLCDGGREFAG